MGQLGVIAVIATCIRASYSNLNDDARETNEAIMNAAKAVHQAQIEFNIRGPTRPGELDVNMCHDVGTNKSGYESCYRNVMWAKQYGISARPEFYTSYPLTNHSSFKDFQYVLFLNKGPGGGPGWDCPIPCNISSDFAQFADQVGAVVGESHEPPQARDENAVVRTFAASAPSVDQKKENLEENHALTDSWPWWTWLLLALCCVPLLGLALSCFLCYGAVESTVQECKGKKKSPSKKKRSIAVGQPKAERQVTEPVARLLPVVRSVAPLNAAPVVATSVPMPFYHPVDVSYSVAPTATARTVPVALPTITAPLMRRTS